MILFATVCLLQSFLHSVLVRVAVRWKTAISKFPALQTWSYLQDSNCRSVATLTKADSPVGI